MATRDAGEAPQFPLNTWGPKGEHACLGSHRFRTYGATGGISPTASVGIPGVTATKLSDGNYRIGHPPCPSGAVDVYLDISQPTSGAQVYSARRVTTHQTGATGYIDFKVMLELAGATTPPTGTSIQALFYVAPVSGG